MELHRLRALAIAIFSALLLPACAVHSDYTRLHIAALQHFDVVATSKRNPNGPIQFDGWSILPPQGEHWIEQWLIPDRTANWVKPIAFVKVVPQRNPEFGIHSVIAAAETHNLTESERRHAATTAGRRDFLNEGLQVLMEVDKVNAKAKQDRIISSRGQLDKSIGYDCLRYDVLVESRHVPRLQGRLYFTEYHTYACIDPGARIIVKLSYGQRVPPDAVPVDLRIEGEPFLKSVTFTPPTS